MRSFRSCVLLSMIALAVVLTIFIFVFWSPNNISSFLGLLISAGLLAIDLIAIISFIVVVFVFKKNTAQQFIKYTIIAVVGILVIVAVIIMSNPLRRSKETIYEQMLKLTPIGTSIEDVLEVIDGNGKWKVWNVNSDGNWDSLSSNIDLYKNVLIERRSIIVLVGEYRTIFATSVSVHWKFDEDLRVIGIDIRKENDVW